MRGFQCGLYEVPLLVAACFSPPRIPILAYPQLLGWPVVNQDFLPGATLTPSPRVDGSLCHALHPGPWHPQRPGLQTQHFRLQGLLATELAFVQEHL